MADCLSQLLGRCCCHETGESCWQEQRVLAVQGQTAYTPAGPVQLSQGNNPRPGQMVVFSDGQAAGSTPQHRSKMRPTTTDGLLPTAAESYASAQRPNNFGQAHLPSNDAQDRPAYSPANSSPVDSNIAISDDGVRHELPGAPGCVDHKDRVIRFPSYPGPSTWTGEQGGTEVTAFYDQFWTNIYAIEGHLQGGLTADDVLGGVRQQQSIVEERRWHYDDGRMIGGELTPFEQFTPAKRLEVTLTLDSGIQTILSYRYRVRKVYLGEDDALGNPITYAEQHLEGQALLNGSLTWIELFRFPAGNPGGVDFEGQNVPGKYPYPPDMFAALPPQEPENFPIWGYSNVFTGFAWGRLEVDRLNLRPTVFPFRWRSPGGDIVVTGPPSREVQQLVDGDVLSWPGGSFQGQNGPSQSWGAFRTRSGTALMIHQAADDPPTVLRVDIPPTGQAGPPAVVTVAEFRAGVLQGQDMFGFDLAGPLMNTWPPQHALIRTQQGGEES